MTPGRETHYIPAFTERNGRQQLAACNIWVTEDRHSDEPTCAVCKAYVLDDCRELTAADLVGVFVFDPTDPLMQPVKSSYAANSDAQLEGYRRR